MELVAEDIKSFEVLEQMLQTLNQVCCDELQAQGHSLECATALLEVANVSGKLYYFVNDCEDALTERVIAGSNLHIVLEAEEGG